jgi:DNA processing protein
MALAKRWRWSQRKVKAWLEQPWSTLEQVQETFQQESFITLADRLKTSGIAFPNTLAAQQFVSWARALTLQDLYDDAQEWLEWESRNPYCLTTCVDAEYPARLLGLADPPSVLWWSKRPEVSTQPQVAIVGARQMTAYGRLGTIQIVSGLVEAGVTIVSGCARGVDITAHAEALRCGGKTLGFLASGVDGASSRVKSLFADKAWLVSEFPPGTEIQKWHFQQRNRLISGLSDTVVVIEAEEESGSMITANAALDQGKSRCVLSPHCLTSHRSGILELIENGSNVVCDARDVLKVIGREPATKSDQTFLNKVLSQAATDQEAEFLRWLCLHNGRVLAADWQSALPQLTVSSWRQMLAVLEARGVITRQAGVVLLSCMIQS